MEKAGKNKAQEYIAKFSIHDMDWLINEIRAGKHYTHYEGVQMSISSLRLQTYTKGTTCVCCGLQAKYFSFERQANQKGGQYHLNLYAIHPMTGEHIMMTSDHILAKSNGGSNSLNNRQPMCRRCNILKGSMDWEEFKALGKEGIYRLRAKQKADKIAERTKNKPKIKVYKKEDGLWYSRRSDLQMRFGPFSHPSDAHRALGIA